jgi:hypothetical protein
MVILIQTENKISSEYYCDHIKMHFSAYMYAKYEEYCARRRRTEGN